MDLEQLRERLAPLFRYGYVGQCVSSVTHDVNNYLGAILAYSELIEQDGDVTPENKRMLANIQENVKRSTEALKTLTMIGRKEKADKSVAELGVFVDQVLNLKRYDFKMDRAALELTTAPNMPNVYIDRPRLAMALLYVLINAYEAVAGRSGARIRVHVGHAGALAEVAVHDTGPGVPASDQARVFEPFFTTKGETHLGLGLTFARDIIRGMGGDLVYVPERGFVFQLKTGAESAQLEHG